MSFRLFVYYSAVCGAWAALAGWGLGQLTSLPSATLQAGLKGLFLGLCVAFVLSLLDALWNHSPSQIQRIAPRVFLSSLIGSSAGLLTGVLGNLLYNVPTHPLVLPAVQVASWTVAGCLIGASIASYDWLARLGTGEDRGGAVGKLRKSLFGGTLGGLLGSLLLVVMVRSLFKDKADPWSPGALGFVTLGACIGLLIGLSQVLFVEAWVKVEAGFRAGRELIIIKPMLTIGRAESCDVGLFGDPEVEKIHARIFWDGDRYLLDDEDSPGGTYLNGRRIDQPTPLRSGDAIQVGHCVLRFGQRRKRS
jgi:hypothetical protein